MASSDKHDSLLRRGIKEYTSPTEKVNNVILWLKKLTKFVEHFSYAFCTIQICTKGTVVFFTAQAIGYRYVCKYVGLFIFCLFVCLYYV